MPEHIITTKIALESVIWQHTLRWRKFELNWELACAVDQGQTLEKSAAEGASFAAQDLAHTDVIARYPGEPAAADADETI